jgi:polysaccharide biosynthesis transport protein
VADRQRAEGMDISAFFGVLRRRVLIIAVVVVAAAGGAYLVSKAQDAKYTATTKLLLKGTSTDQSGPVLGPTIPATAQDREALVTRGAILQATERRLAAQIGRQRAAEAVSDVTAFSGTDSNLISLKAVADSPTVAALAANALARENVRFRKEQTLREVERGRRSARRELAGLDKRNPDNATAIGQLQAELTTLSRAASTADGAAEIVDRATPPSSPSSPKPKRNALIGAFGGLLLGLALALVREQLDRRVRHSKDLEEAFGLPVLASVPKSRALAGQNGKALEQLPAGDAEAFQLLRANLHYLNTEQELRSVVVTSTDVGDGKSTVALNLAKADAAVGKKVLLIEADLRRPRLAGLLGLGNAEGLTKFLADTSKPLVDVTHRVPVGQRGNGAGSSNTLDVVVAGTIPENPSELINSDRMRDLIREGEADYDLVVLDTPPATMVADAIPLMSEATAVIVVGRVGRITSAQADGLREQLERIDAPAFGLVANFAHAPGKYGYGYY